MSEPTTPLFCPSCATRYEVASLHVENLDTLLLCGICGEPSKVRVALSGRAAPKSNLKDVGPRVVVGHEHPGATRTIATVLRANGYSPLAVSRGEQVLAAFDATMPERPAAVCLDVGIPGVLAFEVIGQLRAHPRTKDVPIILLASVFERTRYKRRPNRLYGADGYLELHHVPDRLAEMIDASLSTRAPSDERVQAPVERAFAAPMRDEGKLGDDDEIRARARRLLMDIALYNGDEITRGVRVGDPFVELGAPLDEARLKLRDEAIQSDRANEIFDDEKDQFFGRLTERERARRGTDG